MPDNEEKLVKMLKYVSEHNDFYKNRIKEYGITNPLDITQWPVLTRKELQENRYNMFSDGYKSKYFNQQLHRQASSGSSGVPVNVYWDKKDWYISNLSMWRRRLKYNGIFPNDKYVIFSLNAAGSNKEDISLFVNDISNVLIINASLIFEKEEELSLARIVSDFNPVWLYIQPFILKRLIEAFIKTNIDIPNNLKYIETVGEVLPDDVRKKAMELFNIPPTNFYGSEEFNGIAYETTLHQLEVLEENVFVEILNNDDISLTGKGEAIITGLNNHAVPLIRYNQQDIVSLFQLKLSGRKKPYINNIMGRSYNSVEINHINLNSFFLSELIGNINNTLGDPIREYNFIYDRNNNTLFCNVVLASQFDNWYLTIKEHISRLLKIKFSDSHIIIKVEKKQSISFKGKKWNILDIM